MLILRCMGVQIVDGFLYRGKGLALSGPVQPGLHEILHVETGTRPFLRSFGEEWKLLPPDAMQLFHLFDAIPPKARAVLFRQIENRSEEHTSELQSLMRTSYAVLCLKKKKNTIHIATRKK